MELNIIERSEYESLDMYNWTNITYETRPRKAKEETECEVINAYYLPEFAKKIKNLSP